MRVSILIAAAGLLACAWSGCGGSAEEPHRRAVEAFRARDYPAAVLAANEAVGNDPRHVDSWFLLGRSHAALKQWPEAIEAYERAIDLQPDHVKALHNLGNVHFRRGRHEEAALWYGRALAVDPNYALALFNHGWVLRQLNRVEEAQQMFERCLTIEPESRRGQRIRLDCEYYLGTIRFRQGDYAGAASIMERVVATSPGHVEARHFLGMAYRRLGRLDQAERQLAIHRQMLESARPGTIDLQEHP